MARSTAPHPHGQLALNAPAPAEMPARFMASNPYVHTLIYLLAIVPASSTLTAHQHAFFLSLWRDHSSLPALHPMHPRQPNRSPLLPIWLLARDALIHTFINRTICMRCRQSPLASLELAASDLDDAGRDHGYVAEFRREMRVHHRLPRVARGKWDALMEDLDVPPEVLHREMVEGFVETVWEIEREFVEGNIGVRGCGRGSWCGFHEEVEII